MGRPRKPYVLKEAEGNRGKRKLVDNEIKPKGLLEIPTDMTCPIAIATWEKLVNIMPAGFYTAADQNIVRCYCEEVSLYWNATKHICFTGAELVVQTTRGEQASPYIAIRNKAAENILKFGIRLGLDPMARATLNVTGDAKPKTEEDDTSSYV